MSRTRIIPVSRLIDWARTEFKPLIRESELWDRLKVNYRRQQALEELFRIVPNLTYGKIPTAGRPFTALHFPPPETWVETVASLAGDADGLQFLSPHFSTNAHISVCESLGSYANFGPTYRRVIRHDALLSILKIDQVNSGLVVWILDKALEVQTGGHSLLRGMLWELPPANVLASAMRAYWRRLSGRPEVTGWPELTPSDYHESAVPEEN